MKQLSSRWAAAVLLGPVLIIVAILLVGIDAPEAGSGKGKGFMQILLTGSVSSSSGFFSNPTVELNVVSVRLNSSNDLAVSDGDPSWQTIAVPAGGTAGTTNPSLSFGGNFGPNGNAVSVGQGRSEIQINMGLINSLTIFNTGKIKAETYGQVELVLDPAVPGNVVPPCNVGLSTGEGCITYPLQLSGVSTIRTAVSGLTLVRKNTQQLVVNINAALGPGPTSSNQAVLVTPSICVVPLDSTTNSSCPAPLNSTPLGNFAGFVGGTVTGSTKKTMVITELPDTGTIVSSVGVEPKTGTWSMILPVPNFSAGSTSCSSTPKSCFGTYDIYTTTPGHSIEEQQGVTVFNGAAADAVNPPINFTLVKEPHQGLSGRVFDACTGGGISGAKLELFGATDPTTGARVDCSFTQDALGNAIIPPNCIVIATASTDNNGSFPLPGNGNQASPFTSIPQFPTGQYALKATASGYNTEILGVVTAKGGTLGCPGSGFKKTETECNFSLPHGEIDVTASSAVAAATSPFNLLVTAEDTGTFNGEGVGLVTIPAGSSANANPVPIFVPASATPTASPSPTSSPSPTPVFIGAPPTYDMFASVQDLFGPSPEVNTGHTIAVLSGIPAPTYCQNATTGAPAAALGPVACVGHGSVAGSVNSPDQNTQIVVSKAAPGGANVDLLTTTVVPNGQQDGGAFALCAPVDTYTVTHVEAQPTGTPIPGASVSTTLAAPILINTSPSATPTPPPCQGICSDFSGSNNGKTCLLCQGTGSLPPL